MATSDFRLEVEIWLFRACAMKNMQYNNNNNNANICIARHKQNSSGALITPLFMAELPKVPHL